MATTTITFDFGAYDGRPVLDETPEDTESLDFGAYDGKPVAHPETAAPGGGALPMAMDIYSRRRR